MKRLIYKDYTITPGAIRHERTGRYEPTVHIAWRGADGKEDWVSFTLDERCPTFNDAIAAALEQAKTWANRWIDLVRP